MSEMLCLNHICVSYGSRQILHGIDLSLQPGEFCALLGLNGSGKSTLLHGLCGFLPMAGQVQVNGIECTRMHEKKRAQLLSFLPQTPSLAGGRTTLDAVLMGYNLSLIHIFLAELGENAVDLGAAAYHAGISPGLIQHSLQSGTIGGVAVGAKDIVSLRLNIKSARCV